jgi:hypothetical protein
VTENANHQEDDEDDVDTVIFLLRFTRLPPSYVPVAAHPVVRWLIGITCQARTSGMARTYLTSKGSSITRFYKSCSSRSPQGEQIPLTNPPPEHRTIFLRASTESQATKPSRRWQTLSNKHHRLVTRSPSVTRRNHRMQSH